jgi:hypothetical protein
VWAFGKDAGPRIWYQNPTLRVYDARTLSKDNNGWFLANPDESQADAFTGATTGRIDLNCCSLYLLELTTAGLEERELVPQMAAGAATSN